MVIRVNSFVVCCRPQGLFEVLRDEILVDFVGKWIMNLSLDTHVLTNTSQMKMNEGKNVPFSFIGDKLNPYVICCAAENVCGA